MLHIVKWKCQDVRYHCQTLLSNGSAESLDLGSGIGDYIYAQAVATVRASGGVHRWHAQVVT